MIARDAERQSLSTPDCFWGISKRLKDYQGLAALAATQALETFTASRSMSTGGVQ